MLLEGDLPWALRPLGDERWQRRVSEVPPPEPQDVLTGSSGMLLCPTDREEDVCRQQKGGFFLLLKKVNYLFMHKTQVIVCQTNLCASLCASLRMHQMSCFKTNCVSVSP